MGMVIAVLVAMGCALWSQPGMARPMDEEEAAEFSRKYPAIAGTFGSLKSARGEAFGYTQYIIVGATQDEETGEDKAVVTMIFESGWPMRCFSGQSWDHENQEHARRVNCALAPNGIGPLPVDPRRNRLIPFNPVWLGLAANTLLFALLVRIFPWGMLGRLAPIERGQRVALLELGWLRLRLLASVAIGLILMLGSTFLYALWPRTCLSSPVTSVGMTELPSGAYLMARRLEGTGAVLDALYVLDSPHDDRDDVWDAQDIPPAETIPDPWSASLIGELKEGVEPGHGKFMIGYGWPRTAMSLTHRWEGSGLGAPDARFFRGRDAIWLGASEPQVGYPRALPTRPVVSGLVFNTASYIGAMMAIFLSVGVAQRWIRRRNSQCPTCGHFILRAKGSCPECTNQGQPAPKNLGSPVRGSAIPRESEDVVVPTMFIPGLGPHPGEGELPDDDAKPQTRRRRGAA
jgi:hypothetical protein